MMLAAPYLAMDGMNEAGVGVAQLELETSEVHHNSGKPDMLVSVAMRGILDKCASVGSLLRNTTYTHISVTRITCLLQIKQAFGRC